MPRLPVAVYGLTPDNESEAIGGGAARRRRGRPERREGSRSDQSREATETDTPKMEAAAAPPPPPVEPPPQQPAVDEGELLPPPQTPPPLPAKSETKVANADQKDVTGVEQRQVARRIQSLTEAERLNIYVQALSKKVQTHLVYPEDGRRAGLKGTATVSFAILSNGHIRQESMKVTESSGQPKLDESALRTIRASVPFAPPPREMTIAIAVDFGPKR
jgi:periplasmic protein TonB